MATRTLNDILARQRKPSDPDNVGDIQQLEENKRNMMSAYGNDAQQQWAKTNDPKEKQREAEQRETEQRQAAQKSFVPQSLRGTVYDQRLVMPYAQEAQQQETGNPVDKAQQSAMAGKLGADNSAPSASATDKQSALDRLRMLRQRMEAARQLTPEQKAKLAKKRQTEAAISAVGDGLSALSNLFFTTQYAPNVQGQGQLSAKSQERWDKYNKELADTEKNYADALQKAEQAEREFQLKKRAQDNADKKAEAQIALWNARIAESEPKKKYWETKAAALEAGASIEQAIKEAEKAEAEAKVKLREAQVKTEQGKPAVQKSQIDKNNKQGTAAIMTAEAAQTRAAKAGSGGGGSHGGGSGKPYGTFVGVTYQTRADYDKAVERGAKETGVNTTEPNGFGKTKRRPTSAVANDVEAKKRQQKRSTPSKGRTGKGSAKSKFSIHKK